MLVFVLAVTIMNSRGLSSLQNLSLRGKGGHGWNYFAHKSPSSFARWHL